MMLETYEKHSRAKLIATVVTVLVIAGIVVLADHLKSQSSAMVHTNTASSAAPATTNTTQNDTSANNNQSAVGTTSSGNYKDGTYTATSDYTVPPGDEDIAVSLTLKNGVVTDASIKNSENDSTSAQFQEEFAANYKSYVVGKPISSLKLSVIAGASETTDGFNNAIQQIISKAQA